MLLDLLRKRLQAEAAARCDALCAGAATDHAHYRHLVGVLDGITLALRELTEIEAAIGDDED